MRLLLDTHVLLWWLADDTRLCESARSLIGNGRNEAFVSAASVWEVAIKRALGKIEAPGGLAATIEAEGLTPLPVTFAHAERAGMLPLHHRDPFDRMLIAQAQCDDLTLITADRNIPRYDVRTA